MRWYTAIPLMFFAAGPLLANGDAQAGKIKSYTCIGCHGITTYDNAYPTYNVPKIGGQNYEYLISALQSYHNGARKHPTMQLQASSLSEQDMKDIAAYFSSLGKD